MYHIILTDKIGKIDLYMLYPLSCVESVNLKYFCKVASEEKIIVNKDDCNKHIWTTAHPGNV